MTINFGFSTPQIVQPPAPLSAAELKARLSKCGGLAELKRRLQEFEQNKKEVDCKAAAEERARRQTVAQTEKEADVQADKQDVVQGDASVEAVAPPM